MVNFRAEAGMIYNMCPLTNVAFEGHISFRHIFGNTGGSRLNRIFWEHENLSGLRNNLAYQY